MDFASHSWPRFINSLASYHEAQRLVNVWDITFKYMLEIISPMIGWCEKNGHLPIPVLPELGCAPTCWSRIIESYHIIYKVWHQEYPGDRATETKISPGDHTEILCPSLGLFIIDHRHHPAKCLSLRMLMLPSVQCLLHWMHVSHESSNPKKCSTVWFVMFVYMIDIRFPVTLMHILTSPSTNEQCSKPLSSF